MVRVPCRPALAALLLLSACSDRGPIGTVAATRLAWEATAIGPDWQARIDNPQLTLTVNNRTETLATTYDNTWTGREYYATLSGQPVMLKLMPGPCDINGKQYEFRSRLVIADQQREGCATRNWLAP